MASSLSRLDCRRVLHHLTDLLEDKLDAEVKGQVHDHMIHCKTCRMALESARETLATYFATGPDPARHSRTSLN